MRKVFEKIKKFYKVPKEIENEFREQAEKNTWKTLNFIAVSTIFVQLVNICHVLLISSKKLGTRNNRIYFGFYCVLLLACVLFGIISLFFKEKMKANTAAWIHRIFYMIWLFWGLLLNYYEIVKGPNQNLSVAVTCIMGVAICMQGTLLESFLLCTGAGILFSAAAFPIIDVGGCINVMTAVGLACAASAVKFYYKTDMLMSRKCMDDMNRVLEEKNGELYVSLQKYRFTVESMDNIMFDWDIEHGKVTFSPKWQEKFGYETNVCDLPMWFSTITFLNRSEKQKLLKGLKDAIQNKSLFETEVLVGNQQETQEWYLLRFHPQCEPDGTIKSGIGFLTNIQKQREQVDSIRTKMRQDYLTGILNRKGVQRIAEAQLEKTGGKIMMLLADLDDFKVVNDTYGHPCGDAVLTETAKMLETVFKEDGYAGRIGGDEFMVVCPITEGTENLEKKIGAFIEQGIMVSWKGKEIRIHVSIGGSISRQGDTYITLYQKADYALYRAKKQGKSQCYIEDIQEDGNHE